VIRRTARKSSGITTTGEERKSNGSSTTGEGRNGKGEETRERAARRFSIPRHLMRDPKDEDE
jgi:hypothetical protein